jgi:predicted DNA-binding WGR domain protein
MKGICFSCSAARGLKGKAKIKGAYHVSTERAELYFRQGNPDKVYHLQLENMQERWTVRAQWGRRGSALQSDVKADGVPFEQAKRVYDRILREKTGKGYQIALASKNGDATISVGTPESKVPSGHSPELLTPIEEPEALRLAEDASWWFQQKFDGRRLAVERLCVAWGRLLD